VAEMINNLYPILLLLVFEYIEHMHHSVDLIDHLNSWHPYDGGMDEELCRPEGNASSPQMDDTQISISVNEAGDPQICLGDINTNKL